VTGAIAVSPEWRGIMRHFSGHPNMEAERINTLAGSLADLDHRALELRRYL